MSSAREGRSAEEMEVVAAGLEAPVAVCRAAVAVSAEGLVGGVADISDRGGRKAGKAHRRPPRRYLGEQFGNKALRHDQK